MSCALLVAALASTQQYGVTTEGWSRYGSRDGHGFGACMAAIGDRDGDGHSDLLVGAPGADFAGIDRGAVFLISSRDGSVLLRVDGSQRSGGFGESVAAVGDLDGDGREDFAAGEYLFDLPLIATNAGRFAVFSSRDGSVLLEVRGTSPEELLGHSLSGGADFDGDSVPDFAVADLGGYSAPGAIHLYSGATLLRRLSIQATLSYGYYRTISAVDDLDGDGLADVAAFLSRGSQYELHSHSGLSGAPLYQAGGSNFGSALVPVGDLDSDGIVDFVCGSGAPSASLVSGSTGALIRLLTPAGAPAGFGRSAAAVGDADRDGKPDVLIGARYRNLAVGASAGSAYLMSCADGRTIRVLEGLEAGGEFGAALAGLGDLDGDGVGDWAVSAPKSDMRGFMDAGWIVTAGYRTGLRLRQTDVSAAGGGRLEFRVSFGASFAGRPYQLLASAAGSGNFTLGVDVPLMFDDWVVRSLSLRYPRDLAAQGLFGRLGAQGEAEAWLRIPPGALAGRIGSTLAFAALAYPGLGVGLPEASSIAAELPVLP